MIGAHTNTKAAYKNYSIGDYTYGDPVVLGRWGGNLKVGKFCSIADNVVIMLGGNHRSDWITTYPFTNIYDKEFGHIKGSPEQSSDTVIGSDVWICRGVLILPGVVIGDGSVIGARTVVSKNVEPYSVFVGSPGRVVKKRFSPDLIEKLLEIKWWNWNIEKIKENVHLLCSDNLSAFVEKHYRSGMAT